MKPTVTLREALADPQLLGGAIPGPTWAMWRALLIACIGEALTDDERDLFTSVTGREREPMRCVDELWAIVGRRGGKTRAAGTLGVYLAALCDWSSYLVAGERGVLPVLAASTHQASRCFQHVDGILASSPMLSTLIDGDPTADMISLSTGVDITITPASFRTVRSITAIGAIGDEAAFWQIEGSKNPDREILNALRPSLATTGAPLIIISSPYARRGELFRTYRSDYGPEGDPSILVAKAPSRTFNPSLSQAVVDKAYRRDPAAAAAEYGAEFRTDVEALLTIEAIEACTSPEVIERPPVAGTNYCGFVDPSGGSNDSFTMAIAHRDDQRAIVDVVRERRPPFSPEQVVGDFVSTLKAYGIARVCGDRYAGEWPRAQFRKLGIEYEVGGLTKSDLYRDLVPVINSQSCSLLDIERLSGQLVGLERRTARGGRDSIDHAPGAHDDVANAVAGVISTCLARPVFVYGLLSVIE